MQVKDKAGLSGKDIASSRDHSAVLMRLRALVLEKLSAAGHKLPNRPAVRAPVAAPTPRRADNLVKERPTSYLPAGDTLVQSRETAGGGVAAADSSAVAVGTGEHAGRLAVCDSPTSTSDYTQNQFGTPDTQLTDSILNFAGKSSLTVRPQHLSAIPVELMLFPLPRPSCKLD